MARADEIATKVDQANGLLVAINDDRAGSDAAILEQLDQMIEELDRLRYSGEIIERFPVRGLEASDLLGDAVFRLTRMRDRIASNVLAASLGPTAGADQERDDTVQAVLDGGGVTDRAQIEGAARAAETQPELDATIQNIIDQVDTAPPEPGPAIGTPSDTGIAPPVPEEVIPVGLVQQGEMLPPSLGPMPSIGEASLPSDGAPAPAISQDATGIPQTFVLVGGLLVVIVIIAVVWLVSQGGRSAVVSSPEPGTAAATALASSANSAAATNGSGSVPSESVPGAAAVIIKDNRLVDNVGNPCSEPTTMHASWTVTGAAAGASVIVDMTGPGLPGSATFVVAGDGTFGHDYTVPAGSGVWTTKLVSIGGSPAPVANSTNRATASCN